MKNGFVKIACCWDNDDLDMNSYETDIVWCEEEKVYGVSVLAGRIVPHKEFEVLWRKRSIIG